MSNTVSDTSNSIVSDIDGFLKLLRLGFTKIEPVYNTITQASKSLTRSTGLLGYAVSSKHLMADSSSGIKGVFIPIDVIYGSQMSLYSFDIDLDINDSIVTPTNMLFANSLVSISNKSKLENSGSDVDYNLEVDNYSFKWVSKDGNYLVGSMKCIPLRVYLERESLGVLEMIPKEEQILTGYRSFTELSSNMSEFLNTCSMLTSSRVNGSINLEPLFKSISINPNGSNSVEFSKLLGYVLTISNECSGVSQEHRVVVPATVFNLKSSEFSNLGLSPYFMQFENRSLSNVFRDGETVFNLKMTNEFNRDMILPFISSMKDKAFTLSFSSGEKLTWSCAKQFKLATKYSVLSIKDFLRVCEDAVQNLIESTSNEIPQSRGIVALTHNNELIAYRIAWGSLRYDINAEVAQKLGVSRIPVNKQIKLKLIDGLYVSSSEIKSGKQVIDISSNLDLCQRLINSLI